MDYMMKFLHLIILLGLTGFCTGQTMSKSLVASGGESMNGGEIYLNSTIGEPLIGEILNESSIDQGFWASSLFVETLQPQEELGSIVVYPNPVGNELNIFTGENRVYGLTLFAVDGRMAYRKKVDASQTQHLIDTSILSKGVYVLQVLIEGTSEEKLLKVIKN